MQPVQTLKASIMAAVSQKGSAKFVGMLTPAQVRAVAELVAEGRVRDEYGMDGTLWLIVTRKGVG